MHIPQVMMLRKFKSAEFVTINKSPKYTNGCHFVFQVSQFEFLSKQ